MIILNEYKVHHFIPTGNEFRFSINAPDAAPFNEAPDYRVQIANNITEFVFPEDHYPLRIEDIFIESRSTKIILANRPVYVNFQERRSLFEYDRETRKITFYKQIKGSYNIHWFDFSKMEDQMYQVHWRKLPVSPYQRYMNKTLFQGFYKTNPAVDLQPNIIEEPGTFQGGFRCSLEINTVPLFGMVCLSDDMKYFMYRGSLARGKQQDTFQFRIYNPLGQESDPCCYRIDMVNVPSTK